MAGNIREKKRNFCEKFLPVQCLEQVLLRSTGPAGKDGRFCRGSVSVIQYLRRIYLLDRVNCSGEGDCAIKLFIEPLNTL